MSGELKKCHVLLPIWHQSKNVNVCIRCVPVILFSGDSVVGHQFMEIMVIRMLILEDYIINQYIVLIRDPYDS